MVGAWRVDEGTSTLARAGAVVAEGTLAMVVQRDEWWQAVFTTDTDGLSGDYELRLPDRTRLEVRVTDLREIAAAPSWLHGERPYRPRNHTYAVRGEGRAWLR